MDIRQAGFWPDIEGIFPQRTHDDRPTGDCERGKRLCRYHQFVDRLETSARRARRNRQYALLVMLQFVAKNGLHGDTPAEPQLELLVCRVGSCLRSSDSLCDLGRARFAILLDDSQADSLS